MEELTGASSSSASSYGPSNFDVFLNFRGEDTRNNFTSFLHRALKNSGIHVFIDNEKLWTGEAIGPALLRAIEGSKIMIPVFSMGYASSKWCLLELSQILHCHRSNGQMILPIFLDVEPSHVRHQTGSFEGPFRKHEKHFEPHIVKSWREALRVVGNLKGWVLKADANGDQAELVELVVKKVLDEMSSSTHLAESKYLVGTDSHVKDMLSLLNIGSKDVQFIGICGFGGIGKTTIAKAVYNRIFSTFNRHCFFSDVREQAMQCKGLKSLQKRLLKDIIKTDVYISDHHMGKNVIERTLCKENVILVLDDVDSQEQVDALAGELRWFGPGSRVIITTRDEHILNVAKVDKNKIYWPKELNHMESLQLFSLHAFSMDQPLEDYIQLSNDVACYSGGLPLTLEVLGSYLSDISDKEVWESILQKLKEIPHEKVQRRLKISYDNLEDDYQKAIFLDAACFFIGWEKETVISLWEACGYYPKSAIHVLIKRSLLKFEGGFEEKGEFSKYYLKMHDQIRDMGREIVFEENLMEPGKRSRLWSHGEILEVLEGHKGTDMIKGMILPSDLSRVYPDGNHFEMMFIRTTNLPRVDLDSKHFEMMSNLRFLDISSANFRGEFLCLPSTLKWLRWMTCPWVSLPTNFYHNRLVYLDLSRSDIKQAWNIRPQNENKRFQKLKILHLRNCAFLSKSLHFSWFPHLEQLDIWGCYSLDKLDESIGQLIQLKRLILSFCWGINELPNSIGDLKSLVELQLSMTSINTLPDGVGLLEKLEVLNANSCEKLTKLPRSMRRMRCLRTIDLRETKISKLPNDFSMLRNLVELKISPPTLSEFSPSKVERSREFLDRGEGVKFLSELPSSLVELCCQGCYSLVQLPDLSGLKMLKILSLKGCKKLEEIQGLEGTDSLEELDMRQCFNMTQSSRKVHGQGTLVPYRSRQDRYSLTPNDEIHNKVVILCLVLEFPFEMGHLQTMDLDISASICQKGRITRCFHTLKIEDVEVITDGDIIYIHHFKGFDWFGISLQGNDYIEILDIRARYSVKFWKILFMNREPKQKKLDQYSSAMIVADFFNWTYVNDNLSLTFWSQSEIEGSNSVLKEVEEEEGVRTSASDYKEACVDDKDDEALNDGSNQQTLDQPSHVQENGIPLT